MITHSRKIDLTRKFREKSTVSNLLKLENVHAFQKKNASNELNIFFLKKKKKKKKRRFFAVNF